MCDEKASKCATASDVQQACALDLKGASTLKTLLEDKNGPLKQAPPFETFPHKP